MSILYIILLGDQWLNCVLTDWLKEIRNVEVWWKVFDYLLHLKGYSRHRAAKTASIAILKRHLILKHLISAIKGWFHLYLNLTCDDKINKSSHANWRQDLRNLFNLCWRSEIFREGSPRVRRSSQRARPLIRFTLELPALINVCQVSSVVFSAMRMTFLSRRSNRSKFIVIYDTQYAMSHDYSYSWIGVAHYDW